VQSAVEVATTAQKNTGGTIANGTAGG